MINLLFTSSSRECNSVRLLLLLFVHLYMYPPLLLIMEFERAFLIIIILLLLKSIHTSITTAMPECLLYLSIYLSMCIYKKRQKPKLRITCEYINVYVHILTLSLLGRVLDLNSLTSQVYYYYCYLVFSFPFLWSIFIISYLLLAATSHAQVYSTRRSHTCLPQREERWGGRTLAEERGHLNIHFTKEQCRIILRKLDGPKISPILFMRSEEDWSFWWLWVTCSRHPSIHPPKTIPSVVCWSVFGAITVLKRTTLSKKNWATLHSWCWRWWEMWAKEHFRDYLTC